MQKLKASSFCSYQAILKHLYIILHIDNQASNLKGYFYFRLQNIDQQPASCIEKSAVIFEFFL